MKAWIRLPLDALRASGGVSKAAVIVLSLLCDRAAQQGSTEGITATADELAAAAGSSRRTVARALAELLGLGLISHRRTGRASVYELNAATVELFPEGTFTGCRRRSAAPRAPQRENLSQIDREYLAMVNRFGDEPEPGQMEMEESL